MLTITRRAGEAVHIGDEIVVRVTKVGTTKVKLTIEAPKDAKILRSELIYRSEQK